jgi:nucleoid-associated protein YgaU
MRHPVRGIAVGLTLLAALFAAAWIWQQSLFDAFRTDRARRAGEADRAADPAEGPAPGWGEVLVGGAAGPAPAEAAPGPRPGPRQPVPAIPGPGGDDPGPAPAVPEPVPDPLASPPPETGERQITVGPGESLWGIVNREYGRATPARVEALARFNELENPDLLAPGQPLRLPAPEVLAALAGE